MRRRLPNHRRPTPVIDLLALAIGAAAFGALAVGALAIGRLAVGRMVIKKARFGTIEVDELTVRKLHVVEPVSSPEAAASDLPKAGGGIG